MAAGSQSLRARIAAASKRLWRGLVSTSTMHAHLVAGRALVLFVAGVFAIALVLAVLAAFSGEAPDWVMKGARDSILAGNRHVELTIDYLMRWGLIEALREMLGQVLTIGSGLVIALFVARLIRHSVRLLPWVLDRARARSSRPRLRLTRPLRVTVRDSGTSLRHQFDMHVDFVLARGADLGAIISRLSNVCPVMLRSARDVIDHSAADVSTEEIGAALTRAARKCDKRIHHIELRDVAYTMVGPEGEVMFTQNLPVAA